MTYLQIQFNMEKTKQKLPKWFDGQLYDKGDEVKNPYSGDSCQLTAEELSMYDFIKGAEMCINSGMYLNNKIHNDFNKAIRWFIKTNPKAYMILLD